MKWGKHPRPEPEDSRRAGKGHYTRCGTCNGDGQVEVVVAGKNGEEKRRQPCTAGCTLGWVST